MANYCLHLYLIVYFYANKKLVQNGLFLWSIFSITLSDKGSRPPGQKYLSTSPRFRFAKNVTDAKLEKTSLSADVF